MKSFLPKILFAFLIVSLVYFSQTKGEKEGRLVEKKEYKKFDRIVEDSFQMGCEAAIMKNCSPKNVNSCRKYCFEFISKNPQMLKLLKKKASVLLEEFEENSK